MLVSVLLPRFDLAVTLAARGVEPIEEGLVPHDERPLQRLLGGREGVLRTLASAAAFAPGLKPRQGVAEGRFLVVLAARRARPGRQQIL